MTSLLVLFLSTSAFACGSVSFFPVETNWQILGKQLNLPGHISYNPITQSCCKGKVFNNRGIKCCGSETYDPSKHTCCGGAIIDRVVGKSTCCGQTLYNIADKNSRCCSGKVFELKDDEIGKMACCGQNLYRPGSQICCGDDSKGKGVILPVPEGKNMSCCDTKAYDEDSQVCCLEFSENGPDVWESTLIPLEGNKRDCCGGKGFDVNTHMCCVSVIVERSQQCCGALGYDPKTEACCVHPPPEGSKYPDVSKIPKPDDQTECCNGDPYNTNTQSCCDLKIEDVQQCSPGKDTNPEPTTKKPECTSDTSKELCCGGIRVEKPGWNNVCCYDIQTDEPIPYINTFG